MEKLFNKEILRHYNFTFQGRFFTVYVLDGGEYYDIHILNDKFQENEINTLYLQEPKDCVSLESLDDIKLACLGLEFALWDEFYGKNKKFYSFNVEVAEETEL